LASKFGTLVLFGNPSLLYGDENERVKTVATISDTSNYNTNEHDPDYVEKTFINYFLINFFKYDSSKI
jgi:hypothetical protein